MDLQQRVTNLEAMVKALASKRIQQKDIAPGAVKQLHVAEGVIFLRSGLDANLPKLPETTTQGQPFYWATDTHKLYAWDKAQWRSSTFT